MGNNAVMERYRIEKDGFSAEVNAFGAELKSFKNELTGVEYIWYADPAYWNESAPWLFPIVCDLRKNRTIINNRIYTMPIHGFASRSVFKLVEKTDDSLRLRLEESGETLAQYPFAFSLDIVYRIEKGCLKMDLEVKNRNDVVMPFFIGGHFGINCPMFAGDAFEDMTVEFDTEEALSLPRLDADERIVRTKVENLRFEGKKLALRYDLFDHDALMFATLKSRSAKLVNGEGRGLRVDFADFERLGVWTWPGKHAPYVCIEPWNGIGTCDDEDDVFEHKRSVQYAAPGETKTYRLTLTEI